MKKTILTLTALIALSINANAMSACQASLTTTLKYDGIYKANKSKANISKVISAIKLTRNYCKNELPQTTLNTLKQMQTDFTTLYLFDK